MKILMVTNTFAPQITGVVRSIQAFRAEMEKRGHKVMVVAPGYEGALEDEPGVHRVPAFHDINQSGFSVAYPIDADLTKVIDQFQPDVVHTHHPFLLGNTALRIARSRNLPLVFTHHTMWEEYTHYVPGDPPGMREFLEGLSTTFANEAQRVIAPSESIRKIIRERGVKTPVRVVPTGVDLEYFQTGSGTGLRAILGIPRSAFVVGHVGRLAKEKNLPYLASEVAQFLRTHDEAHFLLVGSGPAREHILEDMDSAGLSDRVHAPGPLEGAFLVSAYQAMDAFAFASHTETQGMVVTEAMAGGVPVVALDAPGVREVVITGENGILLPEEREGTISAALTEIAQADSIRRFELMQGAFRAARKFSLKATADQLEEIYREVADRRPEHGGKPLERAKRFLGAEWSILKGFAHAVGNTFHRKGRKP